MAKKRSVRELTLQILFQIDVGGLAAEEAIGLAFEALPVSERDQAYVRSTIDGILEHRAALDDAIRGRLEGWRFERLANVDKNVLRIAVYELFFRPQVPASVVINEAVEIVKAYSTAESGKFVNGILGALQRQRTALAGDAAEPASPGDVTAANEGDAASVSSSSEG
jgi:N utilization substance protein B